MDNITDLNKMGRSTSSMAKASVTTTSSVVIPYSPSRVALLIFNTPGASISLGFRQDAVVNQGLVMATTPNQVLLSLAQHGDCVHGPWFGIVSAGTQVFSYIETLLDSP